MVTLSSCFSYYCCVFFKISSSVGTLALFSLFIYFLFFFIYLFTCRSRGFPYYFARKRKSSSCFFVRRAICILALLTGKRKLTRYFRSDFAYFKCISSDVDTKSIGLEQLYSTLHSHSHVCN